MTRKYNKGFTLVEILVVLSIIGLLSSTVLSVIDSAREKAQDSQQIEYVESLKNAVYLYRQDHDGLLPPPLNNTSGPGNCCETINNNDPRWESTLLPALSSYIKNPPGHLLGTNIYLVMLASNPMGGDPDVDIGYWPGVCTYPGSVAILGFINNMKYNNSNSIWQGPFWSPTGGIYLVATGNYALEGTDFPRC